jgi:hypothetical protein
MSIETHLKDLYKYFQTPDKEALKKSLRDVHHEGIFSLVFSGTENGKLKRVFISDVKLKPFEVQLHSHRYPLRITVLKGDVKHYIAERTKSKTGVTMSTFIYKSPLNGGSGLSYFEDDKFNIIEHQLPVGSVIELSNLDIHTMSCSKGSIWVVEEMGFKDDSSIVVGVPFITEDLYKEPLQYQTNDNFQLVKKTLKKLINHYDNV